MSPALQRLYGIFRNWSGPRRMALFVKELEPSQETTVLDVGGEAKNWSFVTVEPRLLFLNLHKVDGVGTSQIVADGRRIPFPDKSFQIAYSNSVIEHLHDFASQELFAKEIRRVAKGYFVQTPNRNFPIEPHFLFPLFQFFPRAVRKRVVRWLTPWGLLLRPSEQFASSYVEEIRLLDEREMRQLFPDGEIFEEKFCGLTKSLISIRKPNYSELEDTK